MSTGKLFENSSPDKWLLNNAFKEFFEFCFETFLICISVYTQSITDQRTDLETYENENVGIWKFICLPWFESEEFFFCVRERLYVNNFMQILSSVFAQFCVEVPVSRLLYSWIPFSQNIFAPYQNEVQMKNISWQQMI